MSDKNNDNIFNTLTEALDTAEELFDKNEELVNTITAKMGGGRQEVTVSDSKPLTQLNKASDRVEISLEVSGGEFSDASISLEGENLLVSIDGKVFSANVPKDVEFDGLEYEYNNGVLDIVIPRADADDTIDVSNFDKTDETMEDDGDGTME